MTTELNLELINALQKGAVNINEIQSLIQKGADLNGGEFGFTPLTMAVEMNDYYLVSSLIKMGADVNIPDEEGVSPLIAAAEYGHTRIYELLLVHNACFEINEEELEADYAFSEGVGRFK